MIEKWVRSPIVLAIVFFFYLLFLWQMSVPMTGDQKVYLTIAMEMKEKGEWLIPYLFGKPNFLKPPFQYWATILGWRTFGFNLFGALFPSVLALVLSAVLVKRLANTQSWLPSVFFASTIASMTYGTTSQMEIWIVLFYLLAWALALKGSDVLAFLVVGVMAWIKGPLYPVLWVLSFIAFRAFQGRLREFVGAGFLSKLVLGIAIGLSWFLLAAARFPDEVIGVFFKRENLEKLNTPHGNAIGLWFEFFATLLPVLPWMILSVLDGELRRKIHEKRFFLFGFALLPALFFTFFPYRVGTYLYILTPVAVWVMSELPVKVQGIGRLVLAMVAILAVGLSVLLVRLYKGSWISGGLAVFALMSVLFWVLGYFKVRPAWIAISSLMLVTAIRLGGIGLGTKDLRELKAETENDVAPLSYLMEREDIWHEVGLVSSSLGRRIFLLKEFREISPWLDSGGKVILTEEQTGFGAGLSCREWPRLKRRMKFPLSELILEGVSSDRGEMYRRYLICGRAKT